MAVQYSPEGNLTRIGFDEYYVEAIGEILYKTPQEFAGQTALDVRQACGSGCEFAIRTVGPGEQHAGCDKCSPEQARQFIDDTVTIMRNAESRHREAQELGRIMAAYGNVSEGRMYQRALGSLPMPLTIFAIHKRRRDASNQIKPSERYL